MPRDSFKVVNYAMGANLNLGGKPPAQGTDKYKALALDNITDLWFCAVVLLHFWISFHEQKIGIQTAISQPFLDGLPWNMVGRI